MSAKRPLRTQIPQRFVERDTGIEPAEKRRKTIENTAFFGLELAFFVSVLREKPGHSIFCPYPVSVCDVRVNAYHGLVVCPSAELHHLQLRHA